MPGKIRETLSQTKNRNKNNFPDHFKFDGQFKTDKYNKYVIADKFND